MENKSQASRKSDKWLLSLIIVSLVVIFLATIAGNMLKTSGFEGRCPDWPLCFGSIVPPGDSMAIMDWIHRSLIGLAGIILTISLLYIFRFLRNQNYILIPFIFAFTLFVIQIIFGAVFREQRVWYMSFLHSFLSMIAMAFMVVSLTNFIFYKRFDKEKEYFSLKTKFSKLVLFSFFVLIFVLLSGTILSSFMSENTCNSWPICFPIQPLGWLDMAHRGLVGILVILVIWIFIQSWRTKRSSIPILVSSSLSLTFLFSISLLGQELVGNYPDYMPAIHQAASIAFFLSFVFLTTTVLKGKHTAENEKIELAAIHDRKIGVFIRDLIQLTKPVVVLLLLVTTFAGMVIGAKDWPPFSLAFWTLLGGFMAAGGSGAINQYLDRADDSKMQRTQKRPIPAGRLTPAEGLAYGSILTVGSFFILVAYVNITAALLSLAGIIYYVFLYSIFLKKTTVQNIVIGGGAGAIPPLVGWAAVTGSLDIPSLFLFAVIFMWTPPHFWALALVRKNDYAKAGVPMMPVIRGEKETRKQILIYTLELVALTLLLPVVGLGGAIYLIGAGLLGLWLLSAAYRVWKYEGNKVAWKMYRYSSMYLALLFLVLMVDRLM